MIKHPGFNERDCLICYPMGYVDRVLVDVDPASLRGNDLVVAVVQALQDAGLAARVMGRHAAGMTAQMTERTPCH